jgi:hypothetical protein
MLSLHFYFQLDLTSLLGALNEFFIVYPKRDKDCDVQWDAVVGMIRRMATHLGAEALILAARAMEPLLAALNRELDTKRKDQAPTSSDARLALLRQRLRASQEDVSLKRASSSDDTGLCTRTSSLDETTAG